ncbi:MAG: helix-turn-helix transcriptional regulator [Bacteroidales bacterium]|nr:helix-turn-helix transcriptional regulator [Bacteroidales bacterium]
MNTRLKQFLAAENISQAQFADTIKVVRASVSHVMSGRNNPGYDFIKAIMSSYPTLNIEWLILGKGKMYKDTVQNSPTIPSNNDLPPIFDEPDLFDQGTYPDNMIIDETVADSQVYDNIPAISSSNTPSANAQQVVKQRKAVKVTIFFDDGTYQEMGI